MINILKSFIIFENKLLFFMTFTSLLMFVYAQITSVDLRFFQTVIFIQFAIIMSIFFRYTVPYYKQSLKLRVITGSSNTREFVLQKGIILEVP